MVRTAVALALLAACAAPARAAEPLPPPRLAEPPPVVVFAAPPPRVITRVSAYEHWQYYGVDRTGHFRARVVVVAPDDARYYYNGEPFPYTINYQREFSTFGPSQR
jgi:hypothetical protein